MRRVPPPLQREQAQAEGPPSGLQRRSKALAEVRPIALRPSKILTIFSLQTRSRSRTLPLSPAPSLALPRPPSPSFSPHSRRLALPCVHLTVSRALSCPLPVPRLLVPSRPSRSGAVSRRLWSPLVLPLRLSSTHTVPRRPSRSGVVSCCLWCPLPVSRPLTPPLVSRRSPSSLLVPRRSPLSPVVPHRAPSSPVVPPCRPSCPVVPPRRPSCPVVPRRAPSSSHLHSRHLAPSLLIWRCLLVIQPASFLAHGGITRDPDRQSSPCKSKRQSSGCSVESCYSPQHLRRAWARDPNRRTPFSSCPLSVQGTIGQLRKRMPCSNG